jgi:hypothetical protein
VINSSAQYISNKDLSPKDFYYGFEHFRFLQSAQISEELRKHQNILSGPLKDFDSLIKSACG